MADSPAPVASAPEAFRERVLEHYKHPRNFGVLEPADVDVEEDNPLCGDTVRVTLRLSGGRIEDVRFEGRGCAISLASASLLSERIKGRTVEEILALSRDEIVAMLGIPVSPVRLKCALLPHAAIARGLATK